MLPLDRCFFKVLKEHFGEYCDQWLVNNAGRTIGQDNVSAILVQAYNKVCIIEKAVNAFRICDIVPVEKLLLYDEDLLPATVTDQGHLEEKEVQDPSSSDDEIPLTQMICSNSEVGDESPVRFLVSDFNPFDRSVIPQTSTSKLECPFSPIAKFRTPRELFPYPNISEPRKRMRKGKKSTILTSTPNKEELGNEESRKKEVQR
ncbi:hypothetical protein HHI36_021741 [Cryptolaemus montrouzieri]|uniref:Uncharacterized protein n=1 Tax=Cryptolaemus montrouzieri TaxID=559131 RepID=A0ABD2MZ24_9CUCU